MFTTSRQMRWPDGELIVEVVMGGIDETGPDTLVRKYAGEGESFADPREAVNVACEIVRGWRDDKPGRRVSIAVGGSWGGLCALEPTNFAEARKWAKEIFEKLPKCDRCGEILPEYPYFLVDDPDRKFCREYCAEMAHEADLAFAESGDE